MDAEQTPGLERAAGTSRRVALAAFTGTAMEWYDFYLFGTAAALVFGSVFFPSGDPVVGALASFATFAVGFIARPLGAIVFGHIGDRWGRKRSLLITIWMMGLATAAVGAVPGHGTIGSAGAVLLVLLRLAQGVAMGGEWSGASAMITEQAPPGRRGFYAMLPQLGNPVGILVGTAMFSLLSAILSDATFTSWGWRIPFLMALPFMVIIVWLRRALDDLPVGRHSDAIPAVEVLRSHKSACLIGIGVALLGIAGYYFADTFVLNYATRELELDAAPLLNAGLVGSVLNIFLFLGWGALANRIGGVRVGMLGAGATAVLAIPILAALVIDGDTLTVALAIIGGASLVSVSYAASGEVLNGLFPEHVRQTAIGLAYNGAGVIGGLMPFAATFVMNITDGSAWLTATLLVAMAVITYGSLVLARRRPDHASLERPANETRTRQGSNHV